MVSIATFMCRYLIPAPINVFFGRIVGREASVEFVNNKSIIFHLLSAKIGVIEFQMA